MDYLISFAVSVMAHIVAYIVAKWNDKQHHDKIEMSLYGNTATFFGAADRIRTCGLSGRSRTIYPAELQPHMYENRRWDEIHRIKFVKIWSEKYMAVNSWSDHREKWRGIEFSNGTSPKSSASRHRVTVVGEL